MFKNLYTFETIEMLSTAANEKLTRYAESMPEGKFWNLHNNQPDKADAIGLQADGTVVALFRYGCSINPLMMDATGKKNWGGFTVALSTSSCGGVFYPDFNYQPVVDWELSIKKYNEGLFSKTKVLVAIYVFPVEEKKSVDVEIFRDVDADAFIIPNGASRICTFFSGARNRYIDLCQKIYEFNHIEYNLDEFDNEKMIEMWVVAKEDLNSENLGSHGFKLEIEGVPNYCRFPNYLPMRLFEGKEEGDIVTVIIPIDAYNYEHDDVKTEIYIRFHIRLAQTEYRYRNFGRFEELLARM